MINVIEALRTFKATFVSSFKLSIRYFTPWGRLFSLVTMPTFMVATCWVVNAIMVGPTCFSQYFYLTTGMRDYVTFTIIGFAFHGLIASTLFGGGRAIREEQQMGTMELLFLTPSNKFIWLIAKIVPMLLSSFIDLLYMLVLGLLIFGLTINPNANLPTATFGIILTITGLTSIGFVYAGLCVLAKHHEAVSNALWPVFVFFSGMTFPPEILPWWCQIISEALPLTHGLRIVRQALMLGYGFQQVQGEVLIIIIESLILFPIGFVIFQRLENWAKKTGGLSGY